MSQISLKNHKTWAKFPPKITKHEPNFHEKPQNMSQISAKNHKTWASFCVSIQNPLKVHGIHGINRNDKSNQSGPFSQNALRQRGSPEGHPLSGNGDATFSSWWERRAISAEGMSRRRRSIRTFCEKGGCHQRLLCPSVCSVDSFWIVTFFHGWLISLLKSKLLKSKLNVHEKRRHGLSYSPRTSLTMHCMKWRHSMGMCGGRVDNRWFIWNILPGEYIR